MRSRRVRAHFASAACLFLLGSFRRPVRSAAALAGMLAGFVTSGYLWLSWITDDPLLAWP